MTEAEGTTKTKHVMVDRYYISSNRIDRNGSKCNDNNSNTISSEDGETVIQQFVIVLTTKCNSIRIEADDSGT